MDDSNSDISKLPLPPGPSGRDIRNFIARLKNYHEFLAELNSAYGNIVSARVMGRRMCMVFDPEMIREVFVSKNKSFDKGPAMKRNNFLSTPTILTADGEEHRRHRKLIQPSFHHRALAGYATVMIDETEKMCASWQNDQQGQFADPITDFALRVSSRTLFGEESEAPVDVCQEAMSSMMWGFKLSLLPASKLLQKLPLPANIRAKRAFAQLDKVVRNCIERARSSTEPRIDLLSFLVNATDDEGQFSAYTDAELRDEVYIILMAAHETTTNSLTWVFYHLANNPRVRAKLEEEVDTVIGDRSPTLEDFQKLTYTRAIFDEALRMTPPVHFVGRTAREDIELGGYRIPKGAVVQVCAMAPHHNETHYPSHNEFRPERWLGEEQTVKRPKFSYLPFGGGARVCVGEAFAKMEAAFALAIIARDWRIDSLSSQQPEIESMAFYRFKNGWPVRWSRREK